MKIYSNFKIGDIPTETIPRWHKIFLPFLRSRICEDKDAQVVVIYKQIGKYRWLMRWHNIPPEHINCMCMTCNIK